MATNHTVATPDEYTMNSQVNTSTALSDYMPEVLTVPTAQQMQTHPVAQSNKQVKATTHQSFNTNNNKNTTQFQTITAATAQNGNISKTNLNSAQLLILLTQLRQIWSQSFN